MTKAEMIVAVLLVTVFVFGWLAGRIFETVRHWDYIDHLVDRDSVDGEPRRSSCGCVDRCQQLDIRTQASRHRLER